jgi:hypothetical protein
MIRGDSEHDDSTDFTTNDCMKEDVVVGNARVCSPLCFHLVVCGIQDSSIAAIRRSSSGESTRRDSRDAISFRRVRGYDELAKITLVILPSISSSEQLAGYAGSRASPDGPENPTNRYTVTLVHHLTTLLYNHVHLSFLGDLVCG